MKHVYPMTHKRLLTKDFVAICKKLNKLGRVSVGELTGNQLIILPLIASFESPPSLRELAEEHDTSHQNMKTLLGKLQQTKHVYLFSDRYDYRILRASLTQKGEVAVTRYYEMMKPLVANLYLGLSSDDIEAAHRVNHAVLERLSELHEQSP